MAKDGAAAAAAKSLQSCPSLCDPIDSSPPGSPVPGILQARTVEWVAISFSNAWKWKVKVKLLSHIWLLATPWTAAYQAPLSMRFSRQEHWSGVSLPSLPKMVKISMYLSVYVFISVYSERDREIETDKCPNIFKKLSREQMEVTFHKQETGRMLQWSHRHCFSTPPFPTVCKIQFLYKLLCLIF